MNRTNFFHAKIISKMRHFLFLFLSLLALNLSAQIPDVVPAEYQWQYIQAVRDYEKALETYDVSLSPLERIAIAPTQIFNTGSWAGDYLKTNALYNEIAKIQGKVVIYIFDTAGDFTEHPALRNKARKGAIFTGESSGIDGNGHGLHCGGIAAGQHPDPAIHMGIARALPNVVLVPVKVLNNGGSGQYSWIANGLNWATADYIANYKPLGFKAVGSLSLGGGSTNLEVEQAFKRGMDADFIYVAAAGNTGAEPVQYPGSSNYTLAISALQLNGSNVSIAGYSSRGEIDFTSPGSNIYSSYRNGTYANLSGTSMACPAVAGAVAVLRAKHPTASAAAIVGHFKSHSTDIGETGKDRLYGFGAPVMDKVLNTPLGEEPQQPDPPLPPNPPNPPVPPTDPDREREERTLTMPSAEFEVMWKPMSGVFRRSKMTLVFDFKTKQYDDAAFKIAADALARYNGSRAYVLRDEHGANDMAIWYAIFFDMLFEKQEKVGLVLKEVRIEDNGQKFLHVPKKTTARQARRSTRGKVKPNVIFVQK